MAIQPRQLIGSEKHQKYKIEKKFTDRDSPKEEFHKLMVQLSSENDDNFHYHVLNYYGIGGIGKSSLINELKKVINAKYVDTIYTFADLANINTQNSGRLLLELTKNFSEPNLKFYHFSLAYAIYFQKCNKDIIYNYDKHLVFNEEFGLIADFFSIIEGLGILGIIPGMVNKIYDVSYKKFHLEKELQNDLKQLELMNTTNIEKILPAFFAYDLKQFIKKNPQKKIVIFIDTYEALWQHGKNDATIFSQDSYVRELISHLPRVLFTICSREAIDWKILDSEWEKILTPVLLERFSKNDANDFLLKCGIAEQDIREKMIDVSLGHPYHLDLMIDTYFEMKNFGINPESNLFALDTRTILECFFKYLQVEEIAVIKIVSVARMYDYTLFRHLLLCFPSGYPITMFDEFNKFSFISCLGNGYYHVQEIMRKDILEVISPQLLQDIHKHISDYYISLIEKKRLSYENMKLCVKECIYHAGKYLSQNDYIEYVKKNFFSFMLAMQLKGESTYLYGILLNLYDYVNYDIDEGIFEIYTDMIMLNGNFRVAASELDMFLKKYSLTDITQKGSILHLYVKKLKHQMIFTPLQETIQSIEVILSFLNIGTFPHQYLELLYTKGNMLLEQGYFEKCKKIFSYILEKAEDNQLEDIICRVLRKLVDCCLILNDVTHAHLHYVNGIQIATDNNYDRYKNYLDCSKAEIYRKLKLFEQSKRTYKECQHRFYLLGITPWIAHTELGLAMIDLEQNQFVAMEGHLKTAKNIYKNYDHEWGLIHTNLIYLQGKYKQSQKLELNELLKLEKKCKNMGYLFVLDTLKSLENGNLISSNLLFL